MDGRKDKQTDVIIKKVISDVEKYFIHIGIPSNFLVPAYLSIQKVLRLLTSDIAATS